MQTLSLLLEAKAVSSSRFNQKSERLSMSDTDCSLILYFFAKSTPVKPGLSCFNLHNSFFCKPDKVILFGELELDILFFFRCHGLISGTFKQAFLLTVIL